MKVLSPLLSKDWPARFCWFNCCWFILIVDLIMLKRTQRKCFIPLSSNSTTSSSEKALRHLIKIFTRYRQLILFTFLIRYFVAGCVSELSILFRLYFFNYFLFHEYWVCICWSTWYGTLYVIGWWFITLILLILLHALFNCYCYKIIIQLFPIYLSLWWRNILTNKSMERTVHTMLYFKNNKNRYVVSGATMFHF